MKEKWLNLVELGAVYVISRVIAPYLQNAWPAVPSLWFDIISPALSLVAVGIVSIFFWQRPAVVVSWKKDGDPNPLPDLRLQLRAPHFASEPFDASFQGKPKGFLTVLLMWWLRRHELKLTVVPIGAPVITTVPLSSRIDANTFVGAADVANGFSMKVVTPAQPTTWMWARVFFQGGAQLSDTFQIEYSTTASTKTSQLLSRVVRVTSPAENFHIT